VPQAIPAALGVRRYFGGRPGGRKSVRGTAGLTLARPPPFAWCPGGIPSQWATAGRM